MSLLRCPKFLRCLTADTPNLDRGHSLRPTVVPADSRHCRGRQSGHFLEIASLILPQAALRRFPRFIRHWRCSVRSPQPVHTPAAQ